MFSNECSLKGIKKNASNLLRSVPQIIDNRKVIVKKAAPNRQPLQMTLRSKSLNTTIQYRQKCADTPILFFKAYKK